MTDVHPITLHAFGAEVAAWHRATFTNNTDAATLLGITKVAEEAGELVGALTKYVEGRGTQQAMLNELGDVVIASAGALRRIDDLINCGPLDFDAIVMGRWVDVRRRTYPEARR